MAAFGRAKDSFFRDFLKLRHAIPSHDTFSQVLRMIDPKALDAAFGKVLAEVAALLRDGDVIAIDGKALRGTRDKGESGRTRRMHLVPCGAIAGRDGRSHALSDPAAVGKDFEARGLDRVIDFEHQNDTPAARLNGPVPAAGWIKALQVRADGLWGRVEWTARAAQMIAAKKYRFLSPVIFHHRDTRETMRLKGASLVHSPNLVLTALNSQEPQMSPQPIPANVPARLQDLLRSIIAFSACQPVLRLIR